ncbi:MAG: trypsin-like peptidase domain-containing protein [Clostridia bacterium]|nr:trypsin-like peptidase domain-containing protein [Clostridia bacterium]
MSDPNKQQNEYREPFPYKTYEEILMEKERRRRFHHSMVVMSGIFLMFCAVIIGVGMVWNRSASPFQLLRQTSEEGGFNLAILNHPTEPPADNGKNADFTLPIPNEDSAAPAEPEDGQLIRVADVSAVVKKARASVVGIEAETYAGYVSSRSGSGIILSADGYIITNSHVIEGCDSISVTLDTGEQYIAFVVGNDSYSDLAVLKIDAENLTPAELGDSDRVEVGQPAVAIGNPTGHLQGTTTFGIISGVDRTMVVNNTVMNLIQTDAAINSGNSGGPLLNPQGQVIGINSAKVSVSGYEGLGFAIPINIARPIAEELVRSGSVSARPMLGITASRLSAMASGFYGLPQGLYVTSVDKSQTCGLQAGDVITHINDVHVSTISGAVLVRDQFRAGDTVSVTFSRRGVIRTVPLILLDRLAITSDSNL